MARVLLDVLLIFLGNKFLGTTNVQNSLLQVRVTSWPNSCPQQIQILVSLSANSHSVEKLSIVSIFTLTMIDLQINAVKHWPQGRPSQIQEIACLRGWRLEDPPSLAWLQLHHVTKDNDCHPSKGNMRLVGDLLEPLIQIIEHVGLDHADLINHEKLQVLQLNSLLIQLLGAHTGLVVKGKAEH